jgi:putative FmdB family regulatory protein
MPIYEYVCQKCGHDFEALQKVSDAPLRKCPECGALRLKKLVSKPTFRLKGTGWYETDFKKDGKRLLAESGDGTGAQSKDAADGGSKAEPAKKPITAAKAAKVDPKKDTKKPSAAASGTTGG